MALFPSPSTATVRAEAKLRPEQVSTSYSSNDLDSDIATRIVEEQAYVEVRLRSRRPESALGSMTAQQQTLGTLAVELRAEASLYHTAGQLNEAYHNKAMDYERRAAEILDALLGELEYGASQTQRGHGAASLSTSNYQVLDGLVLSR